MLRFFSVYLLKAWLPDVGLCIRRLYMTWPCVTSPTRDSDTYTTTSSHLILLRLWLHLSGCHAHISICVVKYLLTGASHDSELTVNVQTASPPKTQTKNRFRKVVISYFWVIECSKISVPLEYHEWLSLPNKFYSEILLILSTQSEKY